MTYHRIPKERFYVYFARAGEMMKVGCSAQPTERLKQIGEWIPFEIELVATIPGAFDLEADLHAYFADSWSHLEWFRITPKIEAVVADINAGRGLNVPKLPRDYGKEWFKTLKKRASHRVSKAERHAGRHWTERPQYLVDALASFSGSHNPPPSQDALDAIERFERECARKMASAA